MDNTTECPRSRDAQLRPEDVLPALPLFLGYRPTDSLVCLFFDHDRMVLSSRVDWATCQVAPGEVVETLAARADNCGASAVFITEVETGRPDRATLTDLSLHFVVAGMEVLWAGRSADGAWRGLECLPECPEHLLDPHSPAVVELIAQGWSAAPDRDSVLAEVAPRDQVPDLGSPIAPGPQRERWRDQAIHDAMQLLQSDRPLAAADVSLIAQVCRDIRTRDVVLWRLECTDEGRAVSGERRWQVFATVLRRAPADSIAPVAAVAALIAWQLGEGTRATACLHRAEAADPAHSLASLVRTSVQQAVPPTVWRQCMSSLDEETCRHGTHDHDDEYPE